MRVGPSRQALAEHTQTSWPSLLRLTLLLATRKPKSQNNAPLRRPEGLGARISESLRRPPTTDGAAPRHHPNGSSASQERRGRSHVPRMRTESRSARPPASASGRCVPPNCNDPKRSVPFEPVRFVRFDSAVRPPRPGGAVNLRSATGSP